MEDQMTKPRPWSNFDIQCATSGYSTFERLIETYRNDEAVKQGILKRIWLGSDHRRVFPYENAAFVVKSKTKPDCFEASYTMQPEGVEIRTPFSHTDIDVFARFPDNIQKELADQFFESLIDDIERYRISIQILNEFHSKFAHLLISDAVDIDDGE